MFHTEDTNITPWRMENIYWHSEGLYCLDQDQAIYEGCLTVSVEGNAPLGNVSHYPHTSAQSVTSLRTSFSAPTSYVATLWIGRTSLRTIVFIILQNTYQSAHSYIIQGDTKNWNFWKTQQKLKKSKKKKLLTESHSAEHATHRGWHKRKGTFEMRSGSERMHTWRMTPSTGRNFQTLIIWITVS